MIWYMFESMQLLDEEDMVYDYDFMLETIDYISRELPDNLNYEQAYKIMKEEWDRGIQPKK